MNLKNMPRSEDTEQITVIQWAEWNREEHPELKWLYHCPNGGSRNKVEAIKLRQMGVKAGVSDLHLPYPKGIYHGLFIEMKYGKNRRQESQIEFMEDMEEAGYFVSTCYTAEDAIIIIRKYCELNPQEVMDIPNNSIIKEGTYKGGG